MFSWGEQCAHGFRLKDGTYTAKTNKNGVCYLDLGFHITHLSEGLRVLAFVKPNGNAFIIRTNENKDGTRARGKQKCVECKEKVRAVSCTDDLVMLLTKKGQVLCVDPRLGKGNPRLLKSLSGLSVSQVSCGSQHSIALTKDGLVFTWGHNSRGQLGLGQCGESSPEQVQHLSDLPVVQVAAGGEHSFSVSLSGAVFGWGNNSCGQLGLGDTTDRHIPTCVNYLNTRKTCLISCGLLHTAVLTKDGAVFTFGSGQHGQLGHNSFRDELRPRLIAELLGSKVIQVACGRQHTLVMIESRRLFSFGCGELGQLGQRGESPAVPLPVHLPPEHSEGVKIGSCFAGPNCSFAMCFSEDMQTVSNIGNTWEEQSGLEHLILKWTSDSQPWKQTKPEIHRMFSSLSCLNRSYLEHRKDKHFQTSANYCGLDLTAVERSFANLLNKANVLEQVELTVLGSLCSLNCTSVGVEALRVYLLLTELLVVVLKHNKDSALVKELANTIHSLPSESRKVLRDWHASLPFCTRKRHVEVWRDGLSQMLLGSFNDQKKLVLILEEMHNINATKTGDAKLPEATFSLRLSEAFLQNDVTLWRSSKAKKPCFFSEKLVLCNYKFLMDLPSKIIAFDLDCNWTKKEHQAPQHFNPFFRWIPQSQPDFFYLKLKRASLVEDTFQQLATCSDNILRKPLMVHFDEDPKITDVYKRDLFHHLFLEIVSADSEMLVFNESQTLAWFPSTISKKKKQRFFLFGKLCGLALYNQSIIHLPFPLALFKKLLDIEPCLDDLTELSPTVGKSLQYILDYDANVEDLDMYFTIDWDKTKVELDPSTPGKPVTNDNRQEFVDAYVHHVFTTSVQTAFKEFRRGFFQVCEPSTVQLFRPEELRGVMVGSENYDWAAFRQNTVYELQYHKGHPTIQMFWEVFEELSEEQKKDFLWFLTGYRRAPIFGLGQIQMKVRQKYLPHGGTNEHFPESLTCHSILELPLYSSKSVMRRRLTEAIQPETGFRA
ncbi:probable E3 ubiquitin-protein ligase HERC3 isoform X2 [Periophthalmus magnuspinnatus]|uniref:probable E3 ubiquitin-protein ligase HERC3 isoform X2 n=1 Tax=Periophthalmus magnuspinnatus TaxID=409849 RepID=UPI00145AC416|nr:probable E3 ubiquitin-protein ligase HERC3 isoform X2 [Periophthalmus magnuspinnatus]